MRCHRCHGSMVQEKFYGPGDAFWGWRCIACGEVMDEVIRMEKNAREVREREYC
jgi:hypothetical protein